MNQNVLEYLSSLAKTENKEFILPNIEINAITTAKVEKVTLSELPEIIISSNSISRNIEFTPVGDPSPELKVLIKSRDGYKCVRCGLEENKKFGIYMHIDHAIPRIKGGQNTVNNLQTLCYNCNVVWKGQNIWFGPTLKRENV
jgi:hypothetical protein